MNKLFYFIFVFMIFLTSQSVMSAKNYPERSFDQEQLEEWRADDDYNYDKTPPKVDYEPGYFSKILEAIFKFFGKGFGKLIALLIILFLAYLLYRFIATSDAGFIRNKSTNDSLEEEEIEEHIEKIDYALKLNNALASKNYRLAVRFLYLDLLKSLSNKQLIVWEADKTNHEYLRELERHSLSSNFSKTTFLYEYAWYGDFPISETTYQNMEPTFKKLTSEINQLN